MSDIAMAEQLWTRAHELVKRGEFADAVRDLAQAFQILQAANDPRLYEVHRRWTEVHQMYVEDGARQQQKAQAQQTPTAEAEAEAAANAGDLERAIALYEQVVRDNPAHELARERLQELVHARARAHDLATGRSVEPSPAQPAPSSEANVTAIPTSAFDASPEPSFGASAPSTATTASTSSTSSGAASAAEDDWSDVAVDDSGPRAAAPATSAVSGLPVSGSMIEEVVSVSASVEVVESAPTAEPAGFDVKMSDELSFADLNEPAPATTPAAQAAPAMAPEDAPIGMQSLDVPFSIGAVITAEHADEVPVSGPASQPPSDAVGDAGGASDPVAFLHELLARVQKNRRVA